VSELDLRVYLAILKLLNIGADVTPKLISEIGDIPLSSVYHKIRNYYLVEIKLKEQENGRKKSNNSRRV
jgi:hypothetical protein